MHGNLVSIGFEIRGDDSFVFFGQFFDLENNCIFFKLGGWLRELLLKGKLRLSLKA